MCAAKWAKLKGASRVIGIDKEPERLAFAQEALGIETINFTEFSDVPKRIHELVPGGLDIALDCGVYLAFCLFFMLNRLRPMLMFFCVGTFHEPKTMLHKAQKTVMLETDVPETVNEMIVACRKGGSAGIIAAYAGFCNGFNIGALMEKGVRLIGNGQAPVKKYWEEILNDYIIPGKFDPTLYVFSFYSCEDCAVA